MAWQRKIPFGYMIRDGLIQQHPQEADAVRYIYGQYLAGASMLTIAESMTRQGIRYHRHTAEWNKNMVKRILENTKYIGEGNYPRLVSDEDFAAAQHLRTQRNIYAPLAAEIRPIQNRTVCARCGGRMARGTRSHGQVSWRCQSPDCGQVVTISDEALAGQVDKRLRELAQAPQLLTVPEPRQAKANMETRDTIKDLTLMLMYLTSWEESLVPGLRKKLDRAGIYPKVRLCWKGYDFDILNELTDEGLVNAGGRNKSASFNAEGEAKAQELLKAYGIEIDTSE